MYCVFHRMLIGVAYPSLLNFSRRAANNTSMSSIAAAALFYLSNVVETKFALTVSLEVAGPPATTSSGPVIDRGEAHPPLIRPTGCPSQSSQDALKAEHSGHDEKREPASELRRPGPSKAPCNELGRAVVVEVRIDAEDQPG
jgi:hypothetical protein